jgi:hypothetical protein
VTDIGVLTTMSALNFTETHDYPIYNDNGDIIGWLLANNTKASQFFVWSGYDIAIMQTSLTRIHVVATIGTFLLLLLVCCCSFHSRTVCTRACIHDGNDGMMV